VTPGPMSLGRRDGLLGGRPCCMLRCSCKSVSQLKHLQGPHVQIVMLVFNHATGTLAVLSGHRFIAALTLA